MKNVLIAGGSGLIGRCLTSYLTTKNYHVSWLSRNPNQTSYPSYYWNPDKLEMDGKSLQYQDVIINLAGSSIGEGRWTVERKLQILESRINSIKTLKLGIELNKNPIQQFIQISAIGIYGNWGKELLPEQSIVGKEDFLSKTCSIWEQEADIIKNCVENFSIIRTGLYLHPEGGVWPKINLSKTFRFLNYFGSGQQMYSWIHSNDFNRAIEWILYKNLRGIFNLTSPHAISNKEMVETICRLSESKCICFPVPAFILKLILGEQASLLLNSSNVYPQQLLDSGFSFSYDSIEKAILELEGGMELRSL